MERPRQYRLKETVASNFRDKKGKQILYGERGSIVTEVVTHGDVAIVQGSDKQLFPVQVSKLTAL